MYSAYDATKQYEIIKERWASKNTTLGSINLPTFEYEGSGSNAWVIGGEHTDSGKPLLANDPHLGSTSPPAFYVMELGLLNEDKTVKNQVFGVSMSGVPAISIGLNKDYAWGATAAYIDNKDLFYETVRITKNN